MQFKQILLAGLCLALSLSIHAKDSERWYFGTAILKDGRKVSGHLHYDFKTGVLRLKPQTEDIKAKSLALTAQNTNYFHFFDELFRQERLFVSELIPEGDRYQRATFLEVLIQGQISVLGKLKHLNTRAFDQVSNAIRPNSIFGNPIDYEYFILHNDKLSQITSFKKQLLPIFDEDIDKIELYIKEKNLKKHDHWHQLVIISYFNALHIEREKEKLTKNDVTGEEVVQQKE